MVKGIELVATKDDVRSEIQKLLQDMRGNKREVIAWMFIFWIGHVGATLAIFFLYLKK
ncbi:hypothetical protein [Mucilaginibacter sp. HD30]